MADSPAARVARDDAAFREARHDLQPGRLHGRPVEQAAEQQVAVPLHALAEGRAVVHGGGRVAQLAHAAGLRERRAHSNYAAQNRMASRAKFSPCSAGRHRRALVREPRVRSHCRLRNRAAEYHSVNGPKWTSSSTKRQCDRALCKPLGRALHPLHERHRRRAARAQGSGEARQTGGRDRAAPRAWLHVRERKRQRHDAALNTDPWQCAWPARPRPSPS